MPTPQEIAAAEPLVQEVMKAEMDALRSGKKTREQVGDAALALAKAASALEAVRKAVPDWKGSDEFALIDKAMRVVAFGKGGPVRERYEELRPYHEVWPHRFPIRGEALSTQRCLAV